MSEQKQIGRLAFRVEGDKWTCYYAMPGTMDGAIWMGSIMMAIVEDQDRKQAFMDVMKSALGEFLKHKFGEHPTWGEQAAPESERSGTA